MAPAFATPRLAALPATAALAPALQACVDASRAYFVRAERRRPAPDEAARLVAEAEADAARRVYALAAPDGAVVGLLDLWMDHPEPGTAHVGLLLFHPAHRGRGHGREVMDALERTLADEGVLALRLSVVDENAEVRGFWERLGYGEVDRLERGVTVFEKVLASGAP